MKRFWCVSHGRWTCRAMGFLRLEIALAVGTWRIAIWSVGLCLVVTSVAHPQRLRAWSPTPAMVIQQEGRTESLDLSRLDVAVQIVGYVADTTVTMSFSNPHPQNVQGDFYFPLPRGATVCSYSLDVDGVLREGVPVEKEHAREAFERELSWLNNPRDPGLVEWTGGDWFRTRVFPIPARGRRTVRLQYTSELVDDSSGTAYHLPLGSPREIGSFSLRLEVAKAALPKVRLSSVEGLEFTKRHSSFVAETKAECVVLDKDLVIALPEVEKQEVVVEQTDDGSVYFALQDVPASTNFRGVRPKHVAIYWDASGSRGLGNHKREIDLINTLLTAWTVPIDAKPSSVQVDLVVLRHTQSASRRFVVTDKTISQVTEALSGLYYDGGTQLGAMAIGEGGKPDLALLFSDGLSSFGRSMPKSLGVMLHTFSCGATIQSEILRSLAAAHGGRHYDLSQAEPQDVEILAGMDKPPCMLLSSSVKKGQVGELYPSLPRPVTGHVCVIGCLKSDRASVALAYGGWGRTQQTRTFSIDRAQARRGTTLKHLWAQKKLAELLSHQDRNQKEIAALGRQYGLVTPFTSLMVLERLDQYVRYRIEPPASLPEMRKNYLVQVRHSQPHEDLRRTVKMGQIVSLWQDRVRWWQGVSKPNDSRLPFPTQKLPLAGETVPSMFGPPGVFRSSGKGMAGGAGGGRGMSGGMGGAGGSGGGMGGVNAGGGMFGAAGNAGDVGPGAAPAGGPEAAAPGVEQQVVPGVRTELTPPRRHLRAGDPAVPYLETLRKSRGRESFPAYLKLRQEYADSPAFFFDCADYLFDTNRSEVAVQVLSNVAELGSEDPGLLRQLAERLNRAKVFDAAAIVLEDVLRQRPEEPQSYRDLAIALARRADAVCRKETPSHHDSTLPSSARHGTAIPEAAREDYTRAVELLTEVVTQSWPVDFAGIELPALMELNAMVSRLKTYGIEAKGLEPRLIKSLDVDLRIVLTWFTNQAGIELEVVEPSGHKVHGVQQSASSEGALMTRPVPAGYGPQEYLVHHAAKGKYVVRVRESGNRKGEVLGPLVVRVDVFTNFGRENQQHHATTVRLENAARGQVIDQIKF